MIKEVYEEQKSQYKKGDFVDLVDKDKDELKIKLKDSEIKDITKRKWKSLIKEKVKEKALQDLVRENSLKNKTKHNLYEKLEMSEYLNSNRNTKLANIIFAIRSGTLDIKECNNYGVKNKNINWKDIYENDTNKQYEIAKEVQERMEKRYLAKQEAGLDSKPGSFAPTTVVEHGL